MARSAIWRARESSAGRRSPTSCAGCVPRPWREGRSMPGELILIVEDNEKNLKLVRDLLQIKGYRTVEAATATDGLLLAAEHLPSLILMDVQLPDMDGVAALQ